VWSLGERTLWVAHSADVKEALWGMGGNDDNFSESYGVECRGGMDLHEHFLRKRSITLDEYPTEPPCACTVGLSKVYALRAK